MGSVARAPSWVEIPRSIGMKLGRGGRARAPFVHRSARDAVSAWDRIVRGAVVGCLQRILLQVTRGCRRFLEPRGGL